VRGAAQEDLEPPACGTAREVFAAFLKLGISSFGGPIAHLGYFQHELIERRRWLDASRYAQLVALAQLLPGPASSQIGFALGLIRAGWTGAIAAFVGFTLPSALLLYVLATFMSRFDHPLGRAALHGLKLVAIAVVAQGVVTMARRLTPNVPRALLAAVSTALVLMVGSSISQLLAIAVGGLVGLAFLKAPASTPAAPFGLRYGARSGALLLLLFAVLLTIAFLRPANSSPLAAAAAAFYRSGALVFGGGHVVLPLLQEAVVTPGLVTTDDFLAGYGAAQAVPGPLFSVAAFMGARLEHGQGGLAGAAVAVLAIFLPGLLLVAGALPMWRKFAHRQSAAGAISGINAAVVGLLAAALYDPLWTSTVRAASDVAIAGAAFLVLATTRTSILLVLAGCVALSMARAVVGG
jgi:chromate transporter